MRRDSGQELYKYTDKAGNTLTLVGVLGKRQYANIKPEDNILILIEIKEANTGHKARMAYPVEALEAMWKVMFDVWIMPEKKAKYANRFMELIRASLIQAKLPLT